ncbi:putative bifunctional diguanylate cyclase/phosphodiesterase [Rhodoligotrophos ferricapiens]|uniref:putative bifunctional diguanylate cyclase/phosphodiesterase n=1 Tax=Rhodoligotrophos ferricapiens TaxID=3069264 RepID=UPI00315D105B
MSVQSDIFPFPVKGGDTHETALTERAGRPSPASCREEDVGPALAAAYPSSPGAAADCIILLNADGEILFSSGSCDPAEEIAEIKSTSGDAWNASPLFRQEDRSTVIPGATNFCGQCETQKGHSRWWDFKLGDTSTRLRLVLINRLRQEKPRMGTEAQIAYSHLGAVLESTTDCVVVVDREWRVTYMNRRANALVGGGGKLAVGVNLWEAYPEGLINEFYHNYKKALATKTPVEFEGFVPSAGIWLEVHAYPSPDGLSIFFHDITEAKRARDEIAHLAHHDALTGLANRLKFNECLSELRSRAEGGELAVLLLDLDAFKEVNDSLGHPVGDALLKAIAYRLRNVAQDAGLFARLGGDEFALIHSPNRSGLAPTDLAMRLISCLDDPFEIDAHMLRVGASIGIAMASDSGPSPDDLLKNADIALYRAKAEGGGAYRIYEPGMQEELRQRQALKQDLHNAVKSGELVLEYQPLVDIRSGRITTCEALVRWHHPVRGIIPPAEFIPLAEETGLIESFGQWVLAQACMDAQNWPDNVGVSVNLSPVQFKNRDLPAAITSALSASGLGPVRLHLEITETVLLHHTEHNLNMLSRIKDLGVQFALDDFGTGFSSLSYLRNFPFQKLKIDRSFIADIGSVSQSEAIVAAIIGLAGSLGLNVSAEGVETARQLDWLMRHGCHEAQGYFISKPMSADQMATLLWQSSQVAVG